MEFKYIISLLAGVAYVSAILTVFSPSTYQSLLQTSVIVNSSAQNFGPDPRFSCDLIYSRLELEERDYYANTISAMNKLAQGGDFEGVITGQHFESEPDWPDVTVSYKSSSADNLQRRFIIWGLQQALITRNPSQDFCATIGKLRWNGQDVGNFTIGGTPREEQVFPSIFGGSNNSYTLPTKKDRRDDNDAGEDKSAVTSSPANQGAITINPRFTVLNYPFLMEVVFAASGQVIAYCAERGKDNPFEPMEIEVGDPHDMILQINDLGPQDARTHALRNRQASTALWLAAAWFARQSHSSQFLSPIFLDVREVGVIWIEKGDAASVN